jgi:2-iminobutanoate/2-iminopropanoate deaminase
MEKRIIRTTRAPAAIGPYSQAVGVGSMVYTSGQIALDPNTGQLVAGGIAPETERVMANLVAVLTAAGCTLSDVVKTTIFLTNLGDFATVNEIYSKHFGDSAPARSTVGVQALPRGASVEIEAIAVLPS